MQPMMDTEMVTFSPDEKLSAVRRRLLHATYSPIYLVMDEHQKLLGIFTKTDLLKPIKTRIILVDHNELTQAVNGAAEVNIVEVIDHHRLGNQPTHQPILFHNEPVGSTCTIVADLFRRHGIKPEPAIAGVMMGGVISDTLNLQSPTTTPKDHDILAWLSKQADIAPDDFARHIFSSGSVVLSSSPEKVILSDCKAYEEADVSFSVSQIEELGFDNFWQKADALQKALAEHRRAEGHYFSCLLVTDINTQNSLLVVDGAPDFMEQITYPPLAHDDIFDLPGIVSRKKQLIPYLTSLLTGAGVTEKG
jgi:manganese-dependent inorganic pyrophosphatase